MRIIVSKAYLKWRKANKGNMALGVIDKFLMRVAGALDAAGIVPQPKAAGNNLRKETGVVDEYSLAKEYRVYSKCLELTPGVVTFCLAMVGSKGEKTQSNDILTALGMFDNVNAVDWEEWKPVADLSQTQSTPELVEVAPVVSDNKAPDVKVKKSKGKPVDENGMTVADRKALQKQKRQEQAALARQAKKQKQTTKLKKQIEDSPISYSPVIESVVNGVETAVEPVPECAVDSAPAVESAPVQPTGVTVEFKDYESVQYELEMIEHKINIERLNIKITKQEIALAQHEIALEKLEMRRLELWRMKKIKSM